LYCKKGWVSWLPKSGAPGQSLWLKTIYLLLGRKWGKGFFILAHIAVFLLIRKVILLLSEVREATALVHVG